MFPIIPRFTGCRGHPYLARIIFKLDTTQGGPDRYPSEAFIGHHDVRAAAENRHRLGVLENSR